MAKEHAASTLGNRHPNHNWEYADAAARTSATGFVAGDVHKWALQLDDGSFWRLTDDSPVTWQEVGTGGTHTVKVGPSATFDGGGSAITTAIADAIVRVPYACTVTGWFVNSDASGSIVVDVHRATAGAPTTFSTIAGTEKPTLSGAQSASDTSLTTWGDTTLDEGDWLKFVVDSAATVTFAVVALAVTRVL